MPDRTISILSLALGILVFAYLSLMVVTVSLAAWRTDLAAEVRDTEVRIAQLEQRYYDEIERIGATDPAVVGLAKPSRVTYATMVEAPSVTRR
ncbi:MAG TPA: hypothetical protein VEA36_03390 [Candidatus Paceibacterota bacterium]|nr:hypothetical protein [Candidatus Paceibacterota bacterium]